MFTRTFCNTLFLIEKTALLKIALHSLLQEESVERVLYIFYACSKRRPSQAAVTHIWQTSQSGALGPPAAGTPNPREAGLGRAAPRRWLGVTGSANAAEQWLKYLTSWPRQRPSSVSRSAPLGRTLPLFCGAPAQRLGHISILASCCSCGCDLAGLEFIVVRLAYRTGSGFLCSGISSNIVKISSSVAPISRSQRANMMSARLLSNRRPPI